MKQADQLDSFIKDVEQLDGPEAMIEGRDELS